MAGVNGGEPEKRGGAEVTQQVFEDSKNQVPLGSILGHLPSCNPSLWEGKEEKGANFYHSLPHFSSLPLSCLSRHEI